MRLGAFALTSLERVEHVLQAGRRGCALCRRAKGVAGFVEDQLPSRRLSRAHEATGNVVYEMMAEELARHAMRTMWDESAAPSGSHPPQAEEAIGLLRRRLCTVRRQPCEGAIVLRGSPPPPATAVPGGCRLGALIGCGPGNVAGTARRPLTAGTPGDAPPVIHSDLSMADFRTDSPQRWAPASH